MDRQIDTVTHRMANGQMDIWIDTHTYSHTHRMEKWTDR
jgi:hypothetical protein